MEEKRERECPHHHEPPGGDQGDLASVDVAVLAFVALAFFELALGVEGPDGREEEGHGDDVGYDAYDVWSWDGVVECQDRFESEKHPLRSLYRPHGIM